jgi:hypothetical protein
LGFFFPTFSRIFGLSLGQVPLCFFLFHSTKIGGTFFIYLYSLR